MNINNANTAAEWIQAWETRPIVPGVGSVVIRGRRVAKLRVGVIAGAIDGCWMSCKIMLSARDRYSDEQIADMREAVSVLKLAYREHHGKEYTRN